MQNSRKLNRCRYGNEIKVDHAIYVYVSIGLYINHLAKYQKCLRLEVIEIERS